MSALPSPAALPLPVEPPSAPCICGGGPAIVAVPGRDGEAVPLCQRCVDDLVVRMAHGLVARAADPIAS